MEMVKRRWIKGLGAALWVSVVAAGCGGTDAASSGAPTEIEEVRVTGVVDTALIDAGRRDPVLDASREWAVRLLYPGCSDGAAGAYVPAELAAAMASGSYFEQSAERVQSWSQRSLGVLDAEPCPGARPLVLFSIGLGVSGVHYSLLAERWVEAGYVVAIIDHPYGAPSQLPNGRLLLPDADEEMTRLDQDPMVLERRIADWVRDLLFTAEAVVVGTIGPVGRDDSSAQPSAFSIDPRRVFAVGHSMGGAVALDACRAPEIRACVDLDGAPFGSTTMAEGFRGQGLVLLSHPLYSDEDLAARGRDRATWEAMGRQIAGLWTEIELAGDGKLWRAALAGTGHLSFSDAPVVMPDTIARFGGEPVLEEPALGRVAEVVVTFLEAAGNDRPQDWLAYVERTPEVGVR